VSLTTPLLLFVIIIIVIIVVVTLQTVNDKLSRDDSGKNEVGN
jgi:hypothetical protein